MLNVQYIKLGNVAKQVTKVSEELADYIRRVRNDKGLSLKAVEAASRRAGHEGVSSGYVSQLENRQASNPTKDILRALARGLGVSEKEIFEVARGEAPEANEDFRLSDYFQLWQRRNEIKDPGKRELVDAMIRMLLKEVR